MTRDSNEEEFRSYRVLLYRQMTAKFVLYTN